MEPIKKLNISYEFYHIDEKLDPIIKQDIKKNEALIYVNYFGIKQSTVEKLVKKLKNLIIDNSQAFFCRPLDNIHVFYSPRKFFGVPDGGYLFTTKFLSFNFEKDISLSRTTHLLKRIEFGPELGYQDFVKNDQALSRQSIKIMSDVTKAILQNIDYEYVKNKRNENFFFLHNRLQNLNKLFIEIDKLDGPMVYPFLTKETKLREHLIKNKIYVASYWKNVTDWFLEKKMECNLSVELIPLPVDQRYNKEDMEYIIKTIDQYYER